MHGRPILFTLALVFAGTAQAAADRPLCTREMAFKVRDVTELCGCRRVTPGFLGTVRRARNFDAILRTLETSCPALALALSEIETSAPSGGGPSEDGGGSEGGGGSGGGGSGGGGSGGGDSGGSGESGKLPDNGGGGDAGGDGDDPAPPERPDRPDPVLCRPADHQTRDWGFGGHDRRESRRGGDDGGRGDRKR